MKFNMGPKRLTSNGSVSREVSTTLSKGFDQSIFRAASPPASFRIGKAFTFSLLTKAGKLPLSATSPSSRKASWFATTTIRWHNATIAVRIASTSSILRISRPSQLINRIQRSES